MLRPYLQWVRLMYPTYADRFAELLGWGGVCFVAFANLVDESSSSFIIPWDEWGIFGVIVVGAALMLRFILVEVKGELREQRTELRAMRRSQNHHSQIIISLVGNPDQDDVKRLRQLLERELERMN